MVGQIRAAGGVPVLVTSLTRRNFFDNGTINDALGPWANGKWSLGTLTRGHTQPVALTHV